MSNLELLSFLKRGKNRQLIFSVIEGVMTPSEISLKAFNDTSSHSLALTSRALSELKEKGLIELLNPEEKTGRLYRVTKIGEKCLSNLYK